MFNALEKNRKNPFCGLEALSSLCVKWCVLVFKNKLLRQLHNHFSHPLTWLQDLESKNPGFASLKNIP
jgi:hypothetical protein